MQSRHYLVQHQEGHTLLLIQIIQLIRQNTFKLVQETEEGPEGVDEAPIQLK